MRLFRDSGLPTPTPYGVAELTPERESLLVTEFFDQAVELGEVPVDDDLIDSGLRIVRQLWSAGLAHRDIKPSNLLVRDSQILLIDVAFAELRPTPWRQAIDLANMMLCLALQSSADQVNQRAIRQFTVEDIGEAFAAARGLALPSQLRHALRAQAGICTASSSGCCPPPPARSPSNGGTCAGSPSGAGCWRACYSLRVTAPCSLLPTRIRRISRSTAWPAGRPRRGGSRPRRSRPRPCCRAW